MKSRSGRLRGSNQKRQRATSVFFWGFKKQTSPEPWATGLERVMGIEPTFKAWEALVLPLNYTRQRDQA